MNANEERTAAACSDPPPVTSLAEAAKVQEEAPKQPHTFSKSGRKVPFDQNISIVFQQAEAELDHLALELSQKFGSSFNASLSFNDSLTSTQNGFGASLASIGSDSLDMLENSMRARESQVQYFNTIRGLLYRTQTRLLDSLEGQYLSEQAEVEDKVLTVPKSKGDNVTERKDAETLASVDENLSVGASRSSAQLWQSAGQHVGEALHFSCCLKNVQEYFQRHKLHGLHQAMLVAILKNEPEDPWAFACSFINKVCDGSTQLPASPIKALRHEQDHVFILEEEALLTFIDEQDKTKKQGTNEGLYEES